MPPSKLPPVRTLADWQSAANALFAPGRMPYSYSLLAVLAGPLVKYLDGGCCLIMISGPNSPTAWRAASSVWRKIPEIDVNHKFSDADPPLMTIPHITQRDPHRVWQFVSTLPEKQSKSLVIVNSPRSWDNEVHTGMMNSIVLRLLPQPLRFPDLTPAAGLAGDVFTAYIEQPDVVAWLETAIPALNAELFEMGQRKERLRLRCRTFAVMLVAAKIAEDIDLLALSSARIRSELTRRVSVSAAAKFGVKKERENKANEQADSETVCEAGRQGVAGPAAVGGKHDAADIDVHED